VSEWEFYTDESPCPVCRGTGGGPSATRCVGGTLGGRVYCSVVKSGRPSKSGKTWQHGAAAKQQSKKLRPATRSDMLALLERLKPYTAALEFEGIRQHKNSSPFLAVVCPLCKATGRALFRPTESYSAFMCYACDVLITERELLEKIKQP